MNTITVKYRDLTVMCWTVCIKVKCDEIYQAVKDSPEWQQFIAWRNSVPESEWSHIVIEHIVSE